MSSQQPAVTFDSNVLNMLTSGPERVAEVNLDAIAHNVRTIRSLIGERTLIAVIKADAYGHGAAGIAQTVLDAGADALGLVHVREALALRAVGIDATLMAWLHTPSTDFVLAVQEGIILGASGWDLEAIAYAAQQVGAVARVHLKIDTGLGRNGCTPADWPSFTARAKELQDAGLIAVEGIFTHLAVADEPDRKETDQQLDLFENMVSQARAAGLNPELIHAANTPGTFTAADKETGEILLGNGVRVGLGLYGLSPLAGVTSGDLNLRPAMTVSTRVNSVKEVPAGQGVSYGLNYSTPHATTLALIPVGYADGVPRVATGAPVRLYPNGKAEPRTYPVVGRIAMDQMVIDLGEPGLSAPEHGYLGARAVLFGEGENPPVEEWADAAGTINYEIVTRISPRVARVHTTDKDA